MPAEPSKFVLDYVQELAKELLAQNATRSSLVDALLAGDQDEIRALAAVLAKEATQLNFALGGLATLVALDNASAQPE